MIDLVILFSGGLDSTTLLALALEQGRSPLALSFMYGARHQTREMSAARELAAFYKVPREVMDLRDSFYEIGRASNLTSGAGSVVVPNRNAILLSLTVGLADARGIGEVWFGANASDHAGFPDCRPEFIDAFAEVARLGTRRSVQVRAPFCALAKREVAQLAQRLNVPIARTYSCYEGTREPCGGCDACRTRAEALQ